MVINMERTHGLSSTFTRAYEARPPRPSKEESTFRHPPGLPIPPAITRVLHDTLLVRTPHMPLAGAGAGTTTSASGSVGVALEYEQKVKRYSDFENLYRSYLSTYSSLRTPHMVQQLISEMENSLATWERFPFENFTFLKAVLNSAERDCPKLTPEDSDCLTRISNLNLIIQNSLNQSERSLGSPLCKTDTILICKQIKQDDLVASLKYLTRDIKIFRSSGVLDHTEYSSRLSSLQKQHDGLKRKIGCLKLSGIIDRDVTCLWQTIECDMKEENERALFNPLIQNFKRAHARIKEPRSKDFLELRTIFREIKLYLDRGRPTCYYLQTEIAKIHNIIVSTYVIQVNDLLRSADAAIPPILEIVRHLFKPELDRSNRESFISLLSHWRNRPADIEAFNNLLTDANFAVYDRSK